MIAASTLAALLAAATFLLAMTTHVPSSPRAPATWSGDAIFVPSGDPDDQRTKRAAALMKQGRVRFLVIAGTGMVGDSSRYLAGVAMREGVDERAILLEETSTSTWDNFALCRPLLAAHGIHRLLIVTNRLHARRAVASAHAALPGVDVQVETVDEEDAEMRLRILELGKTVQQIRAGHLPVGTLWGM